MIRPLVAISLFELGRMYLEEGRREEGEDFVIKGTLLARERAVWWPGRRVIDRAA